MSGAEIMSILYDLEPEGREIPATPPDSVGERMPRRSSSCWAAR